MNNKIIKQYFENKFNQENNYKAILSKVRKEEKMGKNKIIKMCATFVLTIGVAAGLAYAGTVVYEKVFKKPEKIDNFVEELQVKDEDLKKIISKQEALEKAKEEIKRYGLELKQNPDIEILKAPNYDEISYVIKSGRLEVNINALTGKLTGFYQNSDNKEKQLEKYHSTKEENENVGIQIETSKTKKIPVETRRVFNRNQGVYQNDKVQDEIEEHTENGCEPKDVKDFDGKEYTETHEHIDIDYYVRQIQNYENEDGEQSINEVFTEKEIKDKLLRDLDKYKDKISTEQIIENVKNEMDADAQIYTREHKLEQ